MPNNALYKFEGQIMFQGSREKIALNAENVVLRGSSLRNTEFVYGLTVFTGHDTKVMKNSLQGKYKFSKLEILVNKSMIIVFVLQIILALIAAICGGVFLSNYKQTAEYIFENDNKLGFMSLFGTWILIFTNFVPISMLVTLEVVKLGQATLMQNEIMMYDEEQDMQMRAQASNLNEELGQVEYVFSDKTGTLTCNVMNFKKFTAGEYAYGTDAKPKTRQEENVEFEDPELDRVLQGTSNEQ